MALGQNLATSQAGLLLSPPSVTQLAFFSQLAWLAPFYFLCEEPIITAQWPSAARASIVFNRESRTKQAEEIFCPTKSNRIEVNLNRI
jgi:hypothetical protein